MKGYIPNNVYKKNLVYGVFEDDKLCGAFETEAEAQSFVDSLQNEEDNNHEYKIIYHE